MTQARSFPRALVVWLHELERWDVNSFCQSNWKLPVEVIRPLSSALERRVEEADQHKEAPGSLQLLTLHFDGTMKPRKSLAEETKGTLYFASPGDVVFSRIDVRNGAIGIVPSSASRAVFSNEFPIYRVCSEVALPEYVHLLFRTAHFRSIINGLISGASGRKRVQAAQLESLKVPLPPLEIQRAIVQRWHDGQCAEAEALKRIAAHQAAIEAEFLAGLGLTVPAATSNRKCLAPEWKDLFNWSQNATRMMQQMHIGACRFPIVPATECIAEIKHGCSSSPSPIETGLHVLKISAATRGEFRPSERKDAIDEARFRREFDLKSGDVLMCRTNGTLRYVGMSALVSQDMSNLIFPDKLIRVRCQSNLLPEYLWHLLQTPMMRAQIESVARTSVGNYAIGSQDIWDFNLPLPSLEVQRALVRQIEARREQIADERAVMEQDALELKRELEAAILGTAPMTGSHSPGIE